MKELETGKDGDIYFWRWKDDSNRFMPYHCWAQKAIFKNGVLRDTYWMSGGEKYLNLEDIDVEFKGNINEMEEIRANEVNYHRSEDVVDMRHSNSSQAKIYIKPDVSRNVDRMREHIRYRIERAESDIRSSESLIERLRDEYAIIEAGKLDDVYL